MSYDINAEMEREKRREMRKRRRTRQIIRRTVFFAVVLIAIIAIVCKVAASEKAKRQESKRPVFIYAENATLFITPTEQDDILLHIGDISTGAAITAAGQQDKPDFVCLPVPMSEEEQKIIYEICEENGVGFCFVMAIIDKESSFTRTARSGTGDSGYMQINDCNAAAMAERGFIDLYDTKQNVGAGVSILRDLFNTYGDDEVHRVLMAYNMGAKNASELWAQGITTSAYSREIVAREAEYSRYLDNHAAAGRQ